nr:PREDICTED: E3 ubiquitin/ISG15 ligase TRIM25-like isoform X1 [Struthio camelus australis]
MAKAKEEFGEVSGLEDELSCPICLYLYRNPMSLSCGHSFCKECIQKAFSVQQQRRAPYSCPMCKIQLGPFLELQKNFQLCSMVETFLATTSKGKEGKGSPEEKREMVPCDLCLDQPQPAVKICLTCDSPLCQAHLNKHNAKASQKDHVLGELGHSVGERKCRKHGMPLEYLCKKEREYLCALCTIGFSHQDHRIVTLKEARDKELGVLSRMVKQMQANESAIANALEDLQKSENQLKTNTETVTSQLVKLFEEIRAKLNQKEQQILSDIESNEKKQLLDITKLKKEMEQKRDEAARHLQSLQEIREQADAFRFLNEFKLAQDRIEKQNFRVDKMEVLVVQLEPARISRLRSLMRDCTSQLDFLRQEVHVGFELLIPLQSLWFLLPLLRTSKWSLLALGGKLLSPLLGHVWRHCTASVKQSNRDCTSTAILQHSSWWSQTLGLFLQGRGVFIVLFSKCTGLEGWVQLYSVTCGNQYLTNCGN